MDNNDNETDNRTLPQAPLIAFAAIIAAMWAATFFPEARVWGADWYGYFSWPGQAVLMAAATALALAVFRWTGRSEAGSEPLPGSNSRFWSAISVLIPLAGLIFYLLRSRTFFLGDGYQVLAKVQAGAEVIKPWDQVTWTVQQAFYIIAGGSGQAAALTGLQLLSILSGLLFILTTAGAARRLLARNRERLLFVGSMAVGGYALLFFGYVENYPLFLLAVALFSLTGLLVGRALWPRWALLIPLVFALSLHPFAVALLPAAGFLLLRDTAVSRRWREYGSHARFALVGAFVVIVFLALYQLWHTSYFFRFALVPIWTDRFTVEGYTLLSGSHLLDIANLVFMLAPGLPLAAVVMMPLPVRAILVRPDYRFLSLLVIASLAVVLVVNPRLGLPRDWDLFCFSGLPLVLLSTWALLDPRNPIPGRSSVALLSVGLGLMVLGPRAVGQAWPEKSIEVFDRFAALDVIKSRNGRFLLQEYLERAGRIDEHNRRALANAVALPHERLASAGLKLAEEGRYLEAIPKFRRALEYDPSYYYAWANLGVVYRRLEQYDSALACLDLADGLNPYSFSTYMKLAGTYYGMGDSAKAEDYWNRAARLKPDDFESRAYLARLYREQDRRVEYETLVTEQLARDSVPLGLLEEAAQMYLDNDDLEAAAETYRRALDRGLDTAVLREIESQHPRLRVLK